MSTCFLFIVTWSEDSAYCIVLDEQSQITSPLKRYDVDEIRAIQLKAVIKVVVPSAYAGIHCLDLPWLGERKSREALPFALEEQLSQPVSSLQIAFSKEFYHQGHYLVVVIDKQRCLDWIALLSSHGIAFESMVLDWFALNHHEVLITDAGILVYADDFKGELSASVAKKYLETHPQLTAVRCRDSHLDLKTLQEIKSKERINQWIASRLNNAKSINLCQGELSVSHYSNVTNQWILWVGGLFCAWILSIFLVNGLQWLQISHAKAKINTDIHTFYQRHFPQETRVVNPKFRIEQLLKTNASTQQRVFWFLLSSLSKVINKNKQLTLKQVNYQDLKLVVKLNCHDFSILEQIETELRQDKVNVVQLSAASEDKEVSAILELSE